MSVGVKSGTMAFEEGDMLTSPGVDEALKRASVVVCNNKMFSESCTCSFVWFGYLGEIIDAGVYSEYSAEEQVPRATRRREDSQSTSLRATRRTE